MINVSGEFTINDPGFNADENSFTVQHDVLKVYAAPYSITKKNANGNFEEFQPKAVEFYNTYAKIYFGSLVLGQDDVMSYQFSIGYDEGE